MSQFISMAEDVRSNFKGSDIDGHIEKYATDKSLNDNEKQRLVEEVNVATFLGKLQEGTHHEDFPIANPIVTHDGEEDAPLESAELNKAASVDYSNQITDSMFSFDNEDAPESLNDLSKVASVSTGDEIFTSESLWDENEAAVEEMKAEEAAGIEKLASETEMYDSLGHLTRAVSISEGMTKTAAVILAKHELNDAATSMLENSKFSHMDVVSSSAEELSKEASEILDTILEKTAKKKVDPSVLKDAGKAIVDVGRGLTSVVKFPIRNPKTALLGAGAAMYANSDRNEEPERQRLKMMANNYQQ